MQPIQRWATLTQDANPRLVQSYLLWIRQNPQVFDEFMQLAEGMAETGRTKYSGWVIVNKMRWEHDITTTGDVFKIRNDFIGMLVRHAVWIKPSFADFFDMRQMGCKSAQPPLPGEV